jgi:ornithine cyclodeaminase/alanine dehydrogenase-like protein (mu-crystallin family)
VSEVRHFTRDDIFALDPRRVADAMQSTLAMVSRGAAVAPVRTAIDLGDGDGTFLISGALTELDVMTVKVISVRPRNPERGLARLQGSLAAFAMSTGEPIATLDARAATEVRTSACSAVSLRHLAREDARVLAVFGSGPQAEGHVRALRAEHAFDEVRIVRHGDGAQARRDAVRGAEVIVTATNSKTPVFEAADVDAGAHVICVGSGSAATCEVEPSLLSRAAAIRVDHRPSCLEESGEIVAALREGLVDEAAVRELGEVVLGRAPGRRSRDEITVYKSVGNGSQDAGLAALLLDRWGSRLT